MTHRARTYLSAVPKEESTVTDPTTDVPVERPNPLGKAALSVGTACAALSGVVGGAAAFGVISGAQADAIDAIGVALPGWITALGTILGVIIPAGAALIGSFHTAKAGRDAVTPGSDPRDVDGHKLVRADGLPLGGR